MAPIGKQTRTLERIRSTFGWNGFPDSLFYASTWALRFNLGGDLAPGPHRFLHAIDRARTVAASVFRDSPKLTVFAGFHDGERRTTRTSRSFRDLAAMGFKHTFTKPEKVLLADQEYIAAFGKDLCRYWSSTELANDAAQLDILLWASVAKDGDIRPKSRWLDLYLADLDRGLVLLVYDDRGMDVIGPSKEATVDLYRNFNPWLLDYDRPRMDRTFLPTGA